MLRCDKKAFPTMAAATDPLSFPVRHENLPMTAQENTSTSAPSNQRVIKKYPNRRLYDTATSTYITLAEVKQLVMERENIVVKDAKTGDDLTRSIFLQIIL